MGTLDPTVDSETVGVLLRELAHTTRSMTQPVETATMIGSLASGLGALRQILDELVAWHERTAEGAVDATGDGDVGYRSSFDVAMQLSEAAMELEHATAAVDAARHTAERIHWPAAEQTPGRTPAVRPDRQLASPSLFGVADAGRRPAGISH